MLSIYCGKGENEVKKNKMELRMRIIFWQHIGSVRLGHQLPAENFLAALANVLIRQAQELLALRK